MVALYYNNNFICDGFLATSYQIVITAAHFLEGMTKSSMLIYSGLQTLSPHTNTQCRHVSNWKIYPNYYSS
jgi:hypothetical protein